MNSQRDISRRLLDPEFSGSLAPPPAPESVAADPIAVARKVVARSKRRVTFLTWATCIMWILATATGCTRAGVYFIGKRSVAEHEYRYAQINEKIRQVQKREDVVLGHASWRDCLNEEEYKGFMSSVRQLGKADMVLVLLVQATILLTGIAALMSIWLITASRRCAMKQINVNLAAICHELKAMSA